MYNWIGRRVKLINGNGDHRLVNQGREGVVLEFSYIKGAPQYNMIRVLFDGENQADNYFQWRFELVEDNKSSSLPLPLPG